MFQFECISDVYNVNSARTSGSGYNFNFDRLVAERLRTLRDAHDETHQQ